MYSKYFQANIIWNSVLYSFWLRWRWKSFRKWGSGTYVYSFYVFFFRISKHFQFIPLFHIIFYFIQFFYIYIFFNFNPFINLKLQDKVMQLYKLEKRLQTESLTIQGLQKDKVRFGRWFILIKSFYSFSFYLIRQTHFFYFYKSGSFIFYKIFKLYFLNIRKDWFK